MDHLLEAIKKKANAINIKLLNPELEREKLNRYHKIISDRMPILKKQIWHNSRYFNMRVKIYNKLSDVLVEKHSSGITTKALMLETYLYNSAKSFTEYKNTTTIRRRVNAYIAILFK